METQKKKVNFNKSGSGHETVRAIIPKDWANDMGLSKKENEIEMSYDTKKKEITIKKHD